MSDQDFFFDEDDKPAKPAAKSGSKPAAKSSSGSSKAASARSSAPVPSTDAPTVSVTVAVLLAIIGVLLGVVIGLFVGQSMATPDLAASAGVGATAAQAPELTTEQLNSSTLPSGHPAIGGSSTATPTK